MRLSNELLSELTREEWDTMFNAIKDTTIEMGVSATFTLEGLRGISIDTNSEELAVFVCEYLQMLGVDCEMKDVLP